MNLQPPSPDEADALARLPYTPDSSALVACPYCGAEVELLLDPAGGAVQRYVEDCEVCCRPWQVTARWNPAGDARVEVTTDDA